MVKIAVRTKYGVTVITSKGDTEQDVIANASAIIGETSVITVMGHNHDPKKLGSITRRVKDNDHIVELSVYGVIFAESNRITFHKWDTHRIKDRDCLLAAIPVFLHYFIYHNSAFNNFYSTSSTTTEPLTISTVLHLRQRNLQQFSY